MIGFIIGVFAGVFFGTFTMALMTAAGRADRQIITGGNKNA